MPVKNRFAELLPEIAAWRRDFHQHPELDYDVHRTADRVAELLRAFYGFTFVGYSRAFGWDPFGTPPELGATGVPIYLVAPDAAVERAANEQDFGRLLGGGM